MGTEPLRVALLRGPRGSFDGVHAACVEAGHEPVLLVCARADRPGRAPVQQDAAGLSALLATAPPGVDLLLPHGVPSLTEALRAYRVDLAVSCGFPWRLTAAALGAPRLGAVNLHPSLLPRHRGPAPVHWAIREGDARLGWTAHWMDEGFDTGRILASQAVPMPADPSPASVWGVLDPAGLSVLTTALRRVAAGDPGAVQDEDAATYAGFMDRDFYAVDWSRPAVEIHRQVRVFRFGLPHRAGPLARLGGDLVTLLDTRLTPGPGTPVPCGQDTTIWVTSSEPAG